MKKILFLFLIFSLLSVSLISKSFALNISSTTTIQGDPVKIEITDLKSNESIKSITVNNESVFFTKNFTGKNYYALYGAGLSVDPGKYILKVKTNLNTYSKDLTVLKRYVPVESFSFATSTVGTSTEEQNNFVSDYLKTLIAENKILGSLWSNKNIKLKSNFRKPLKENIITDTYGYSRSMATDALITHKGTDYRAATGTEVYSINRGVVRLVKNFSVYGNTVIIDHGNGLMSMYMHLEKLIAKQGYIIEKGALVGLSGMTGAVTGPHLHLTIKLNGESVDPEKFFEIMGVE